MKIRNCYTRFVLPCFFAGLLIFSIPALSFSAKPGLLCSDGVRTHTIDDDPFLFTVLEHGVKVVDYDGIAYDGSSHAVTVTYPDETEEDLEFFHKESDHAAFYGFWDDSIEQPIDVDLYSGNYVYRVTEVQGGDYAEAIDDLDVQPVNPPNETSFSPGYGSPQRIIACFDKVWVGGLLYDDFDAGFDPLKWDEQEVPFVDGEACFDQEWSTSESDVLGMNLLQYETSDELAATVRIDDISEGPPVARIGGTYFNDGEGDIEAMVFISGDETKYVIYRNIENSGLIIREWVVPPTLLSDKLTKGNNYRLSIKWDGKAFTFGVIGLDVNETDTFTPSGDINPTENDRRIEVYSWVTVDSTTPIFNWDTDSTVTSYGVCIHNSDGENIFCGDCKSPPYQLPPGVLKPGGEYFYVIFAFKHHQWFEWDNFAPSEWGHSWFLVEAEEEAQKPYVDLYHQGVSTWTRTPPLGTLTNFSIKVHDAQGVPENIKSVKVLIPTNPVTEMKLYLQKNDSETCGRYRAHYFGTILSGKYKFIVKDKDGNSYSKTEMFTPDPIDPPSEATLIPANNEVIDDTGVSFDWDNVPGAAFYELTFYDEDLDYMFNVKTTESDYTLPPGILEEESLYRYRISTRREFFEDNVDNGSLAPANTWDSNTFFTTETYGTALPSMNLDSFGVTVWKAPHPATGDPVCQLEFFAMVTDDDGVPDNIEKVEVTYPDGTTTRLLKYVDNPNWGSNYQAFEDYPTPSSIQDTTNSTGIYTFTVVDFDGHEVTLQDTLTDVVSNILPWPTNVAPANDTVLNNTMPTISWDPVTGASYYKVRILEGWAGSTVHWSEELTQAQYTVQNGILEPNTTYGYRVYAYRVLTENEVDFYSSNHLWHPINNHFTTKVNEKITLFDPNGLNVIPADSTYTIEWWAPAGADSFKLKYSMDNGTTWKLIAKEIAGTSYDWTVPTPNKNKTNCLVKVMAYDASGTKVGADKSDAPFTIEVLTVTSPEAGEVVASGGTHVITWESYGIEDDVDYVKVMCSADNGATWETIDETTSGEGDPGMYLWDPVTVLKKNTTNCLIKVIAYDDTGNKVAVDKSDVFTIEVMKVTSPNGGETLTSGETYEITWYVNITKKDVETIKLLYTKNGGKKWVKIEPALGPEDVSYDWTVPDVSKEKTKCKVKLVLKAASGKTVGKDASDGYFAIQPAIP